MIAGAESHSFKMEKATSCNSSCTRLQIGISSPGAIPDVAFNTFFDSTWINLGDVPSADSSINLVEQPKSMVLRAQFKGSYGDLVHHMIDAA